MHKSKRYGIEIEANWGDAASVIFWRSYGSNDEWEPTVFQVANARHDWREAMKMVNRWLSYQ